MKKGIWRHANGTKVPMANLTNAEAQEAFLLACNREYAIFNQINMLYDKIETYNDLKKDLKELSRGRNLKLKYPDELSNFKSKNQHTYFSAQRKEDNAALLEQKAVISAEEEQ
jgi:hypothetical protein